MFWFDLVTMKIQFMGGKITENLGFESPLQKVKKNCPFSVHFEILHIFVFNHFWISCFRNQISIKTNIFNMFYLITKQDIKKWLKSKIPSFLWRIWKWQEKKGQKIFDLLERGFEPQIFSNFPAHDLNFHGRWDQM